MRSLPDRADFRLDPRLEADTHPIARLSLCDVMLMDNAHYPWLILVPRRDAVTELTDLPAADRAQLARETEQVASLLKRLYPAMKLNLGALGNVVSQLHVHVVCRREGDAAWPAPVWGGPRIPYATEARESLVQRLRNALHKA